MVINILIDNEKICQLIRSHELNRLGVVIERLDNFSNHYILPETGWEELVDLLYQNFRDEDCRLLSKKLEKRYMNGQEEIEIDENKYQTNMQEIMELCRMESENVQEILLNKKVFHTDDFRIYYGNDYALRSIESLNDLKLVLMLFGCSIKSEHEFTEYIIKLYWNLWFDEDIEASIKKLEAGLEVRKGEILYHLYCIEKEVPEIIKKYGPIDNQSMGGYLSIPCSPERNRTLVKNELTKKADNGNVVCELHSKMGKIGSRKPDRIYFCANVPKGILLNKKSMQGRIYIYKITKHV